MLTKLQERKLTKMFRYLDVDQDGVLVRADYDRICGRLLGALEPPHNSKEAVEIEESYAFEWGELQLIAEQQKQKVTLPLWLSYRAQKLSGPDAFENEIEPYVQTVFMLLDKDNDGQISYPELRRYLKGIYLMPEDEFLEVLGRLDPAKRGSFSSQEITQLAREFYFSDDENSPGSWLLGRF